MLTSVRTTVLFSVVSLAAHAAAQDLPIEVNVFQGFSSSMRTVPAPPLLIYFPPASGWSADIASQRRQLQETLGVDGAALLTGNRAIVSYDTRHQFEALRGEIVVSVLPRRSGPDTLDLDVSITTGKGAEAATATVCASGRVGSTIVLGAPSPPLPNGWATASNPLFIAITPLTHLSVPATWPVGADITPPKEVSRVQPRFPPEAKREGRSGVVVFDVVIDASGAVAAVHIGRHADPDLELAALEAVRQWRYQPATRNGVPVPVWFSITMRFQPPPEPASTPVPAA